jgi:hypothetical protein
MQDMRKIVSGTDLSNPFKHQHNIKATQATIKKLLADGTPNWVKFPNDYKNFVRESFQAAKEESDSQVSGYKMERQELLMNAKARKVNAISTRDFIDKLRRNGVKCFTVDNGFPPQTIALWAVKPDSDKLQYVCYLQVPAMYEWSVLKVDRHGLPAGEDFRGWRTVLAQLITKQILTEAKAHKIFGRPTDGEVSVIYRESLWFLRNHAELDAGPADYQF